MGLKRRTSERLPARRNLPDATCPHCDRTFQIADFLASCRDYATSTDSGVAPCPFCSKELEFRARSGAIELGYTYWAGSFHFEGMVTVLVPGLRRRRDEASVTLELDGEPIWPVPGS